MYRDPIDLKSPSYTPERLIGEVMWVLRAESRAQAARVLEFDEGQFSKVWNRGTPIPANLFVQIADRTDWSIRYMRELAGIPYDGAVFPPRARVVKQCRKHEYHVAKQNILLSMPGTTAALVKKSGYSRPTVNHWIKALREGDPLTRASHITDWMPPNGRGPHLPVHAAGPGEDAVCIIRPRSKERHYARGVA